MTKAERARLIARRLRILQWAELHIDSDELAVSAACTG